MRDAELLVEHDAWDAVRRARDVGRPTTSDYLRMMLDDFEELHGDRVGGDCPAIVGGVGRLGGESVVVIGHEKGHTPGRAGRPQLRHARTRPATARPVG